MMIVWEALPHSPGVVGRRCNILMRIIWTPRVDGEPRTAGTSPSSKIDESHILHCADLLSGTLYLRQNDPGSKRRRQYQASGEHCQATMLIPTYRAVPRGFGAFELQPSVICRMPTSPFV